MCVCVCEGGGGGAICGLMNSVYLSSLESGYSIPGSLPLCQVHRL